MNKYLSLLLLLTLSFTGVLSLAQYASPNINCDELIRDTYNNNARTQVTYVVTTENAQRCLADAGLYNYTDSNGNQVFTGKYWSATEQAAEAYINRDKKPTVAGQPAPDPEAAKKADAAKAESLRLAEQEKLDLQKKADDLKLQSQVNTQANVVNSTSATNNLNTAGTSNSQVAIGNTATPISDSREPASADKFLINSIYFLFALPFILFAISIIAAFLKVFKKPNE
jgi:hypothetical protein